jgi:acyl carrier protein
VSRPARPLPRAREELRRELEALLVGTGRVGAARLADGAPLLTSGLIDSVALFTLALWVEEAIGAPVDLTRLALPAQWDTVERILDFVAEQAPRA